MRFRLSSVVVEAAVVLCCAPVLLFPLQFPKVTIAAVALIATTSLAGAVARRAWRVPTPLFWPALGLSVMVAAGAAVSTFPDVSVPKLAGVGLGVLVARLLVLGLETRRQLWGAVVLYLAGGAATVVSGVLGTRWIWGSKTALAPLVLRIPLMIQGLPGAEMGVNPNALGGTTLFFIPLLTCLAVGLLRARHAGDVTRNGLHFTAFGRDLPLAAARGAVLVMLLGVVVVLVLSQSRTSWASALGAVAVIAAIGLRSRWWGWLGSAALVVIVVVALVRPTWKFTEGHSTLANAPLSRVAIWAAGVEDVRSSPWLGIGLNVFRKTISVRPRPAGPPADVDIAHAHNVFLQTALDAGLPGLVAYLALLLLAAALCLRVYATADLPERLLALGLLGNLIAVHLFGVTDAIVLGAKVGLFFWWNLGLVAALHLQATRSHHVQSRP